MPKPKNNTVKKTRARPAKRSASRTPASAIRKSKARKPRIVTPNVMPATPVIGIQQRRKLFSLKHLHLPMHLTIAGTAIVILLILGSINPNTFATLTGSAEVPGQNVQIGLEYSGPANLEMLFARKGSAGYLAIANRSPVGVKISVPEAWHRTEVRGRPISEFVSEPPEFGYRRWTLPPHSGISMILDRSPDAIEFFSPSSTIAAITLRSVDVLHETQLINVVLLDKEVRAELWEE